MRIVFVVNKVAVAIAGCTGCQSGTVPVFNRAAGGDSRPRNSIHRREDKLHGPQCSSGGVKGLVGARNAARGGADVRSRLQRETMARTNGIDVYAILSSSRRHHGAGASWTGQRDSNRLQEIPCYSNSLNNYLVRLLSTTTMRVLRIFQPVSFVVVFPRAPRIFPLFRSDGAMSFFF